MKLSSFAVVVLIAAGCHAVATGAAKDGGTIVLDSGGTGAPGLSITPAAATMTVTDLSSLPTQQLTATLTNADGTQEGVSASWTVDRFDIAGVDSSTGIVTAAGSAFGIVTVTASSQGLTATAMITVELKVVVNPGGASAGYTAKLDQASGTDPLVAGLLYPYDGTVFPRALLAPELMWKGGADADLYRIHLAADHFDFTVYANQVTPSRYTPPQSLWDSLVASAAGKTVAVDLRRLDSTSGNAYVAATQTWTIADANLRGTIYYWAINEGQIVALDVTTGTRTNAFDSGPSDMIGTPTPVNSGAPLSPPWEDNGAGKRCVACHSVSKSGNKLSGVFTRQSSTGPIGFVDLATSTPTVVGDYTNNLTYDALVPDGSLAVANYGNNTMALIDTSTGMPIASALDGMTKVCDPSFSPDGLTFALSDACDGGYPVEFTSANLVVYDFDQTTRTFSNPRTVQTSTGSGDAIAFPSFSPDSTQVFYQRGSYSRAKYGDTSMGMFLHGIDDLYVSNVAAGGTQVALDNANGIHVLPSDSLHLNYGPTVNPISSGGYTWVVFTSPRDYGNEMVSPAGAAPSDATYSNRKQLWVTAVDAHLGTTDPSHPAFWLPGQDLTSINMFGYWALSPCKATSQGTSCSAGFECCSGFCRDSGSGPMCVDAPTGCAQVNEKCTTAADCCGGISCIAGFCQSGIQ